MAYAGRKGWLLGEGAVVQVHVHSGAAPASHDERLP